MVFSSVHLRILAQVGSIPDPVPALSRASPLSRACCVAWFLLLLCVFPLVVADTRAASQADKHESAAAAAANAALASALTESAVKARAKSYLEALRLNDWHTAYSMELGRIDGDLTPFSFMQAIRATGVRVLSYEITKVNLGSDGAASVEADVTYRVPQLFNPYKSHLRTDWVLRDGTLYRYDQVTGSPAPPE